LLKFPIIPNVTIQLVFESVYRAAIDDICWLFISIINNSLTKVFCVVNCSLVSTNVPHKNYNNENIRKNEDRVAQNKRSG